MKYIQLKPFRQTWLSQDLLDSAPAARLCMINGKQWAQLDHPRGGPLTCVQNRTGKAASGVERIGGKWCWVFEHTEANG